MNSSLYELSTPKALIPLSGSSLLIADQKESDLKTAIHQLFKLKSAFASPLLIKTEGADSLIDDFEAQTNSTETTELSLQFSLPNGTPHLAELCAWLQENAESGGIFSLKIKTDQGRKRILNASLGTQIFITEEEKTKFCNRKSANCFTPSKPEGFSAFVSLCNHLFDQIICIEKNSNATQLIKNAKLNDSKKWLVSTPAGQKALKDIEKNISTLLKQPIVLGLSNHPELPIDITLPGSPKKNLAETEIGMATVIALLAQSQAALSAKTALPTVLIDSPEEFLPKELIQHFFEQMNTTGTQVIATTASPIVLKHFFFNHVKIIK